MKLFRNADKRLVASGLTVAAGAVLIYCIADNFAAVREWLSTFFSYFSSVTWGLVLAYVMRPVAELFEKLLSPIVKKEKRRVNLGAICALVVLVGLITVILRTLLPNLIASITAFVNNIDGYVIGAKEFINTLLARFDELDIDLEKFIGSSDELLRKGADWVGDNVDNIADIAVTFSSRIINFIIIMVMATYALFDRKNLKRGTKRLSRVVFGEEKSVKVIKVVTRGDELMKTFLSSNFVDAVIIGVINYIFLGIVKSPYQLLLALLLGVTNYIPTFGPIVGGIIGGIIVLLTKPELVLGFILFTVILQQIDGNVIKPLLFGDSTGLSAFWVLVAIVVGGKMFGVVGMLLGVPVVALLASLLGELLDRDAPDAEGPRAKLSEPFIRKIYRKLVTGAGARDVSQPIITDAPAPVAADGTAGWTGFAKTSGENADGEAASSCKPSSESAAPKAAPAKNGKNKGKKK